MEEPGKLQSMGSLRVGHGWATSLSLFHFHALEKEMATHSSVLAWRIPGTGELGGLLSMGLQRVGHDWSNLAAAAAVKAMVSPVVMYGCESWTIKKAEGQRIDALELWWWRRLVRVPWTARRSNWFPFGWTVLMSLQSKGLSRVFSNTTVQKHQFFSAQPSLWSNSHIHTWLLEKPYFWLRWVFVGKV